MLAKPHSRILRPLLLLVGLLAAPSGSGAAAQPAPDPLVAADAQGTPRGVEQIPPRPAAAMTGSKFIRSETGISGGPREDAIRHQIVSGNVPGFLRNLVPVPLALRRGDRTARATIWVTPDYLAIGSDADFVRVPMNFHTAAAIARTFGMTLPTRRMVDAIYAAAKVKLSPSPMPPTSAMTTTRYFAAHNQTIEEQRSGYTLGDLIAGHKKDLVLTGLLKKRPLPVAIYGWHQRNSQPIQPLSIVHGAAYADYSHGVRLVSRLAVVDGKVLDIFEVLRDPERARILTLEGSIAEPSRLLAPTAPARAPAK